MFPDGFQNSDNVLKNGHLFFSPEKVVDPDHQEYFFGFGIDNLLQPVNHLVGCVAAKSPVT